MTSPWSGAVISGIGATAFSTASGRSEAELALEAINNAVSDAGLELGDIDGLVTYTVDSNDPADIATLLRLDCLNFWNVSAFGGAGACAAVDDAVRAVSAGMAEAVVVYRALNGRSSVRFGSNAAALTGPQYAFSAPYGIVTPAHSLALNTSRYMHHFNLTNEHWAPVAVAARRAAATNPNARFFGRPITTDDHQTSAWVVEPVLRLFDCCLETDGAVALVVTQSGRASSTKPEVKIAGAARSMVGNTGGITRDYYRPSILNLAETEAVGEQLWRQSGLQPRDVQAAIIYDHFSPYVIRQLEALGFCDLGAGPDFVRDGGIELDGHLPVNPHGGQLAEGYIHGLNGIAEGIRQVRGSAVNQVRNVEHVVVTSGPVQATSGLVLSR